MASATEQAVRRLEAALRSLEVAVRRRLAEGAGAADLSAEVAMLTTDRAGLAESLDRSEARATRLEHVNRDVSRRLTAAIEAVSAILEDDARRD